MTVDAAPLTCVKPEQPSRATHGLGQEGCWVRCRHGDVRVCCWMGSMEMSAARTDEALIDVQKRRSGAKISIGAR